MTAARHDAPAAAAQALESQLDALGADADQRRQLHAYLALMQRWNRVYNLTAVRDPGQMLVLHLADCLALLPHLALPAGARLLDVGSGAGLPGIPVAVMRPDLEVVVCDAVQKKCAFLRQVAAELGLSRVRVVHARVEDLEPPGFDCITSRAFSDLATLVGLTRHLLAPGGSWAAMKGRAPDDEIAALPADIATSVEPLTVPGLDAERCVVRMHPRADSPTND